MDCRHEVKHIITAGDAAAIRTNLSAVAHLDPHAQENGYYRIRSLYFDDPMDTALHEKLDGVNERRISGRRIILRGRIQHRYLDLDRSMRRRIADSGPDYPKDTGSQQLNTVHAASPCRERQLFNPLRRRPYCRGHSFPCGPLI